MKFQSLGPTDIIDKLVVEYINTLTTRDSPHIIRAGLEAVVLSDPTIETEEIEMVENVKVVERVEEAEEVEQVEEVEEVKEMEIELLKPVKNSKKSLDVSSGTKLFNAILKPILDNLELKV